MAQRHCPHQQHARTPHVIIVDIGHDIRPHDRERPALGQRWNRTRPSEALWCTDAVKSRGAMQRFWVCLLLSLVVLCRLTLAAADWDRPDPMSAVRSWSAEAEPSASPDSPGPEPRSFREGAELGLIMTQHWTRRLPSGRRYARAALASRDPWVSAASRAASGLVMHLLWCSPGTHHAGVVTPRLHLWAPVHRPSWTLTSPTEHDTIPIRIRRSVVQRLSATAFYPSWRTTRDKTLFVRHHDGNTRKPTDRGPYHIQWGLGICGVCMTRLLRRTFRLTAPGGPIWVCR